MLNFYIHKLKEKLHNHTYRQTINTDCISSTVVKRNKKKVVSFACNDYFGLSQNKKIKKSAIKAIKKYGVGARASRFITGNNSLYDKLEKKIAQIKLTKDSLVFSSGYQAAIGVIPALVGKGDLIVADKLIHSSFIDAAKLSGARLLRFEHNDIDHAKKILTKSRLEFSKCIILSETVFSMDGDLGKINELLRLAIDYKAYLVSDAAHDLFINSPIIDENHIQMGTLSKGVGTFGGYVAGTKQIIDYLRNYSKSLIYSTAIPPAILSASIESLNIIKKEHPGKHALDNAKYFLAKFDELKKLTSIKQYYLSAGIADSAIVPIIIGDDKKVVEISADIEKKGFLISAIRFPTVPKGTSRLRLTFSSEHSKKEIEKLVKALIDVLVSKDVSE